MSSSPAKVASKTASDSHINSSAPRSPRLSEVPEKSRSHIGILDNRDKEIRIKKSISSASTTRFTRRRRRSDASLQQIQQAALLSNRTSIGSQSVDGLADEITHASSSSLSTTSTQQQSRINTRNKPLGDDLNMIVGLLTEAIGANDAQLDEVMALFDTAVDPSIRDEHSGVLPDESLRLFVLLSKRVKKLLTRQARLREIVRVQSIARAWLCRRTYLQYAPIHSALVERNSLLTQLIASERNYCTELGEIINGFLGAIRGSHSTDKPLLPIQEIPNVFCNIEEIRANHSKFYQSIAELRSQFPFVKAVGSVLLSLRNTLKCYGVYVENFRNAVETLRRIALRQKSFAQFLDSCVDAVLSSRPDDPHVAAAKQKMASHHHENEKNSGSSSSRQKHTIPLGAFYLETLLHLPLQRVEDYEKLYKNIADVWPDNLEDHSDLMAAHSLVHNTVAFLERRLSNAENRAAIVSCQRRLTGYEGPLNLLDNKNRRAIAEGPLHHNKHKKYIFLFNDLILLCKPVSTETFRLLSKLPLSQDSKFTVSTHKEKSWRYTISSAVEDEPDIELTLKSQEDHERWSTLIQKCIETRKEDKVFGRSLEEVVQQEADGHTVSPAALPKIFREATEYLTLPENISKTGLFRLSGSKKIIERMKSDFDAGSPNAGNWLKYPGAGPSEVAGLLKLYVRELPEPLLTHQAYNQFKESQMKFSEDSITLEEHLENIREQVCSLPPHYFHATKHMITFLEQVSQHHEQNMMNSKNLSIVFGPNIIRPEVETIESTLSQPVMNHVVMLMIEFPRLVFGDDMDPGELKKALRLYREKRKDSAQGAPTVVNLSAMRSIPSSSNTMIPGRRNTGPSTSSTLVSSSSKDFSRGSTTTKERKKKKGSRIKFTERNKEQRSPEKQSSGILKSLKKLTVSASKDQVERRDRSKTQNAASISRSRSRESSLAQLKSPSQEDTSLPKSRSMNSLERSATTPE
mmetsp:Transcript_28022/g.70360  ORF Transcript_28022/g.70360 Transcript_28022/m.70360 type:complete len:973 (+) Transcript_28022:110-3028(+)|eukprot:CAMPEP_0177648752 /NCGR_PEP_ID=MMETSP0447-20121125/10997_1 /TAXON_ID=0 /ORGANISM="Stygamoeba regulata, Strain BSH-02190019" /LENGTH=972 /DNA_ID=CAMNT_0019151417 /DNA_START=93 /DNA_END=3011 /DNA_ORIENTATION=+